MKSFLLASLTLFRREVVRFFRQKHRIFTTLATPLVFWGFLGSGLGGSFSGYGDYNYLQYFLPGTILLVVMFTAIFSTISIIEDRREGFLQGVLTAPVPRSSIVLGNILGGTFLASVQGLIFILLAPVLGIPLSLPGALWSLLILILVSFGLTGLGLSFAWRLDSSQAFHGIMNLFLMPLWLVSGALFPVQNAPDWLKILMHVNPLTYAITGLQKGLFGSSITNEGLLFQGPVILGMGLLFTAGAFLLAVKSAQKN